MMKQELVHPSPQVSLPFVEPVPSPGGTPQPRLGPPYHVIYADPPWVYRDVKTGGSHQSGAAQHYPTMTPAVVATLSVRHLVAPDATLWLWATVPLLPEILPVVAAWGFTYKTAVFWHKTGRLGMGHWLRNQVEILLFGIRGTVPAFHSSLRNHIDAPFERHSQKPAVFRDLIETLTPHQARVELFARRPSCAAWTCTGIDSDGIDLRP